MSKGKVFHGIDFSGSKRPEKKIWVSSWTPGGSVCFHTNLNYKELVKLITGSAQDRKKHFFLIDTVFSLPFELLRLHGIETCWSEQVNWLASFKTPVSWRQACRSKTRRELKRLTDKINRAPFSPTNVRMFRQTWHGILSLLRPLRSFEKVALMPFDVIQRPEVWQKARVWVGEGCPACFLKKESLPWKNYKGKGKDCEKAREKILCFLIEEAGLRFGEKELRLLLSEKGTDALDSAILLPSAKRFSETDHRRLIRKNLQIIKEGWIYV